MIIESTTRLLRFEVLRRAIRFRQWSGPNGDDAALRTPNLRRLEGYHRFHWLASS
jgi:hypothetical protein